MLWFANNNNNNNTTMIPRFLLLMLMEQWILVTFYYNQSVAYSLAMNINMNNNDNNINPNNFYGKTTRNVATQILQGTGPITVDMNRYNLPSLEQITNEWTANFVQKSTETKPKAFLAAKNEREHFVDTVLVTFPRRVDNGGGLGLELEELAGGRQDGLGITLIRRVTPNGPADGCDILPGDSIAEICLVRKKVNKQNTDNDKNNINQPFLKETQQQWVVKTECLSFDATVNAIQSGIPPPPTAADNEEDIYTLKLKRLRRKPRVMIKLQYPPSQNEPDTTIEMFAGENLRQGMLVRGVKLNDPLAKRFDTKTGGNCGAGGLCRTCVVSVMSGGDKLLNPQRVAEKQMLQDTPRWRLACKAIVGHGMTEGEMTIRVNPRQW